MPTRVTGNCGYIKFGGSIVHVTGWTLTDEVDDEDSTTTESCGWEQVEPVINRMSINANALIDLDQFPSVVANPNLVGGAKGEMQLFVGDPVDDRKFVGPALIKSVEYDSKVKSLVKYGITAKSNGEWTRPAA